MFDCLPYGPIKRLADLYQRGAAKYDKHNWKKGIDQGRCFSSMIRHAFQALAVEQGEASADMVAEDHLAAVVFNAFAIMYNQERKPAESTSHDVTLRRDGTPRLNETEVRLDKVVAPFKDRTAEEEDSIPLLYICGQLTDGGKCLPYNPTAVAMMNEVSAELMKAGFAVIMPQLTVHFPQADEIAGDFKSSHRLWLKVDREIIKRCDGLVRVENGTSLGADYEVDQAGKMGVPIFYRKPGRACEGSLTSPSIFKRNIKGKVSYA